MIGVSEVLLILAVIAFLIGLVPQAPALGWTNIGLALFAGAHLA